MNNNGDKGENLLVLIIMLFIVFLIALYFAREYIGQFQRLLIMLDFEILTYVKPLQLLYPEDIMRYKALVHSEAFAITGLNVIEGTYYNEYKGYEYNTLDRLFETFFVMNNIILMFALTPLAWFIKKVYSAKIIKFKINRKKEEVYPGLIDNKRRPSKNDVFEVMDYFPPILNGSTNEFIAGSIRLSKKQLDSSWMEVQRNKLEALKSEMPEQDYLRLKYLDKVFIRNFNDNELLDYIRIEVYRGKKPERNNKRPPKDLPKILTKENKEDYIKILKSNLITHSVDIEYGRLLMPDYYIFTPLESKKINEFETPGIKELVSVLKKYVMDDFRKEVNKTIKELQDEVKKLKKNNDNESLDSIKQNENLIIEMQNMLDPDFNNSRNQKILNLATIHSFEETFLMGLLIYGRTLVNLPVGVMAKMKFQNAALWYALTSYGRTYQYNAGLPIAVMYKIEKEEAEEREKEKLDIEDINPEELITDNLKEVMNETIGDQYTGGKAFDDGEQTIRRKRISDRKRTINPSEKNNTNKE